MPSGLVRVALATLAVGCGRTELDVGPTAAGGREAGSSGGPAAAGAATGPGGHRGELCDGLTTNHRPGSRLRARSFVTPQGMRGWDGWWDSERQERCRFDRLAGAGIHCVPEIRSSSQRVFADAGCVRPVYTRAVSVDCTEVPYVVSSTSGCGEAWGNTYFEVGTPSLITQAYVVANDGSCQPTRLPPAALFERGAEIPAPRFVAAELVELEPTHRVRARGYLADDGTRQVQSWVDTALPGNPPCSFGPDETGRRRCLPLGASLDLAAGFADASCQSPLLIPDTTCPDAALPAYGFQRADRTCYDSPRRTFAVGVAFTGQMYGLLRNGGGDACRPFEAVPKSPAYATALLASETLAEISPVDRGESARDHLQPRYDISDDGGCWFYGFWDTAREGTCWFGRAEDGQWRCLPSSEAEVRQVFEDEACQNSAWLGSGSCSSASAPPAFVSALTTGECNATTRVFRNAGTAEQLGHRKLFQVTVNGCRALPPGFEREMWLTPVPPSELESATLVTE